jgi:hypothetical protein
MDENIRPKQLKQILNSWVKSPERLKKRSIMLWGQPGIGKSDIVKSIAKENNMDFIDLRLLLFDPTDLKGMYGIREDKLVWLKPPMLPTKNGGGILFLDELTSAPPTVQGAAYQLVLDRKCGEYELPDNWVIIAASNNLEDKSLVYSMPTALLNRFVHYTLKTDFDDWKEWAMENEVHKDVISFLNWKKGHVLMTFDPKVNVKAFATPRSWEFVSDILYTAMSREQKVSSIIGAVGVGPALEFEGYLKIAADLPNVEQILIDEEDIVPEEMSAKHAICGSILTYVQKNKKYVDRMLQYSFKLPEEFAVLLVKDALRTKLKKHIIESDAFDKWQDHFVKLLRL